MSKASRGARKNSPKNKKSNSTVCTNTTPLKSTYNTTCSPFQNAIKSPIDFDVTDEEIDKSLNDTKPHESTGHQPILISGKGSDIRGMLKASSSFYQNKNIFKLDNGVQAENASTQMMYDPQKGIWLGNNKDVEDFPDFDDSDSEKGQTPSVFVLTDKEKDVILKCAQEHQKSLNGWGVYANLTEGQLKEDKKSLKMMAIGYLIGLRKVCTEEQYIEEEFEKAEQAKLAKKREDSQNFSREDIEDDWDGLDIEDDMVLKLHPNQESSTEQQIDKSEEWGTDGSDFDQSFEPTLTQQPSLLKLQLSASSDTDNTDFDMNDFDMDIVETKKDTASQQKKPELITPEMMKSMHVITPAQLNDVDMSGFESDDEEEKHKCPELNDAKKKSRSDANTIGSLNSMPSISFCNSLTSTNLPASLTEPIKTISKKSTGSLKSLRSKSSGMLLRNAMRDADCRKREEPYFLANLDEDVGNQTLRTKRSLSSIKEYFSNERQARAPKAPQDSCAEADARQGEDASAHSAPKMDRRAKTVMFEKEPDNTENDELASTAVTPKSESKKSKRTLSKKQSANVSTTSAASPAANSAACFSGATLSEDSKRLANEMFGFFLKRHGITFVH